jgi:hypothetical protein
MHDPDSTDPHPPTPISLSPSNAPQTRFDVVLSVIGWIAYAGLMAGVMSLIGECVHRYKYGFWPDWSVSSLAYPLSVQLLAFGFIWLVLAVVLAIGPTIGLAFLTSFRK